MAKITINGVTHRQACLNGASVNEADAAAYDDRIGDYFAWLRKQVEAAGHEFDVDEHGQGGASYRVSTDEEGDHQSAHDLMQSTSDFWAWY